MAVLLDLCGLRKAFPGTLALDGVDFQLQEGEVHALMGENGAGKSTLIKAITGVHPPDEGKILLAGREVRPRSPQEAVSLGISTVYQEVNLAPNLTVMENLLLGREPRGLFGIKWKEAQVRAEAAMQRLGFRTGSSSGPASSAGALDKLGGEIDVRAPLSSCSVAVQQMIAIGRALDVSAKVLILDEPTSSLDADEVQALFQVVRKLRSEGLGIIFVTHFLDQMYEISDRITVLRNGRRVGGWRAADLPRIQLVSQMIGRDAAELERGAQSSAEEAKGDPIVSASGLGRRGSVAGVSLEVRPGETLGLAGLLGSGRTETLRLIYGIDAPDSGALKLDGRAVARMKPRAAIRAGIGCCSEDRKKEGIFPELSIRENILILTQVKQGWIRRMPLRRQKELARSLADRLKIQPPDVERPIQNLSGGNQQKALLARWLAVEPRLLLLDEPTRGIDVGAKFEIMSLVESLRQAGGAFVFVSSELPEVVRSCTKVLVMRDRKAGRTLGSGQISEAAIVEEIAG